MSVTVYIIDIATACVIGFCAALQVTYYLNLKRKAYFWIEAAVGAALAYAYTFIDGIPQQILFALAAVTACCLLCIASYKEQIYHKLYSTVIQAVITVAILYVSAHIVSYLNLSEEQAHGALFCSVLFFNAIWCAVMYVALKKVFTVLPEPESNYRKTFYASCIVLAALFFCEYGGESLLLELFPSELVFSGLISIIVVLSVLGILWMCQQSNSQMIEEDRLMLISSQNQIMKHYVDEYVDYSNSVRVIEHDQQHLIDTLSTLLEMEDTHQAKKILSELSKRNADLKRKVFCSDNTLNAILTDAFNSCKTLSIGFDASVRLPEPIAIEDIDLISLVKNMLNNAIECCMKLEDPTRGRIDANIYTAAGHLVVHCVNTVDKAPLIHDNKIDTTKYGDGLRHGIGIESIHIVAKTYSGTVHMESNGNAFTIKVVLENRGALPNV